MVSAPDAGSSVPSSSLGRGYSVVFLGKTRNLHSASLHTGVKMGSADIMLGGGGGVPCGGLASHSWGVEYSLQADNALLTAVKVTFLCCKFMNFLFSDEF